MGSFGRPACLFALDVVEREGKSETGDGHPGQNKPDSQIAPVYLRVSGSLKAKRGFRGKGRTTDLPGSTSSLPEVPSPD